MKRWIGCSTDNEMIMNIRKITMLTMALLFWGALCAQKVEVSLERMQQIYDEVRTPYKYGLVVAPADNSHQIDCPTVFREGGRWYMT